MEPDLDLDFDFDSNSYNLKAIRIYTKMPFQKNNGKDISNESHFEQIILAIFFGSCDIQHEQITFDYIQNDAAICAVTLKIWSDRESYLGNLRNNIRM